MHSNFAVDFIREHGIHTARANLFEGATFIGKCNDLRTMQMSAREVLARAPRIHENTYLRVVQRGQIRVLGRVPASGEEHLAYPNIRHGE